jgi:hypothetical protein
MQLMNNRSSLGQKVAVQQGLHPLCQGAEGDG